LVLAMIVVPAYAQETLVTTVPQQAEAGETNFRISHFRIAPRSGATACDARVHLEVSAGSVTLTAYSLDAMVDDDADPTTPDVCNDKAWSLIVLINTMNFSAGQSLQNRLIAWGKGDIAQYQPDQLLPAGAIQ